MPRNPDRSELCHFAYADGRRCTQPQFPDDFGLCFHHGQQHRARLEAREAGRRISRFLHTDILTACDLSSTLSTLFQATAQGFIKPKAAASLAYLAQLMLQTQKLAKEEFLETYEKPWADVVADGPAFDGPEGEAEPATPDAGADGSAEGEAAAEASLTPANPSSEPAGTGLHGGDDSASSGADAEDSLVPCPCAGPSSKTEGVE